MPFDQHENDDEELHSKNKIKFTLLYWVFKTDFETALVYRTLRTLVKTSLSIETHKTRYYLCLFTISSKLRSSNAL